MKLDLSILKDEKKEIYTHLWSKQDFSFNVIETGVKDPSYEFEFAGKCLVDYVGEAIASNFGLEKTMELFIKKFRMACSGTGDELKKITTLHSSSLCALLFFFNVENKPLVIPGLEDFEFNKSIFEFKNKVIGYPSNIDIVLLGTNKEHKPIVLFLESKFSEYITGVKRAGTKYEVGKSYFKEGCYSAPIYEAMIEKLQIQKDFNNLISEKDKYIEGLKQLISHYYGIRNFLAGKPYDENDENYKILKNYNAEEIILGEIVFDNFGKDIKEKYLEPYEKDCKALAKILNNQCKKDNLTKPWFHVLDIPLRYSSLKDYISGFIKIKDYYFSNDE